MEFDNVTAPDMPLEPENVDSTLFGMTLLDGHEYHQQQNILPSVEHGLQNIDLLAWERSIPCFETNAHGFEDLSSSWLDQHSLHDTSTTHPIDIPSRFSNLNPLDRWSASPPELEPVSESAIRDAIANTTFYGSSGSYASFRDGPSQPHSSRAASSTGSENSYGSAYSRPLTPAPHMKRRRRQIKIKRTDLRRPQERRPYQCTFCTDTFKTKYDWQRHETTLHLSLERWQCCKTGPVIQSPDNGASFCVFCNEPDPSPAHLETHSYAACIAKPVTARSFYRKDHLMQHLRLFHSGCALTKSMAAEWVFSITAIKSRCGFCDATMTTWAERAKHLARHFRKGADMKDWTGGRGLDDWANELVENDMPAYMIGRQRHTLDPFSASQVAHRYDPLDPRNLNVDASSGTSSPQPIDNIGLQSFRYNKRKLLLWTKEQINRGHVPTDQELRSWGNDTIYGPGSNWDPAWTDNPECLEELKKEAGLISLPLTGGKNAFIGRSNSDDT